MQREPAGRQQRLGIGQRPAPAIKADHPLQIGDRLATQRVAVNTRLAQLLQPLPAPASLARPGHGAPAYLRRMPRKSQLCGIARTHAAALNSPHSLPNDGERDHGTRTFNTTADAAAHAGRGRRGARGGYRSGDGVIGVAGELVAGRPSARDRDDPFAGAGRRRHGDRTQADRSRLPAHQPCRRPALARRLPGRRRRRRRRLPRHRAQFADRGAAVWRFRHPALPDGVRRRRRRHPCHPPGMDHGALRASARTLADRLGTVHRHPEQPGLFIESIKPVS